MGVGPQITTFVDHIISNVVVSLNVCQENIQKCRVDEEFKVSLCSMSELDDFMKEKKKPMNHLLINVAIAWAPAEDWVVASGTIHSGL